MYTNEDIVTLENIGNGAAIELFNRELAAVLENILDVNTSETAKRSITLKIDIKPASDRGMGAVDISCKSTLAPTHSFQTKLFFGRDKNGPKAVEYDPKQPFLPFSGQQPEPMNEDKPANVTPISKGA